MTQYLYNIIIILQNIIHIKIIKRRCNYAILIHHCYAKDIMININQIIQY